MDKVFLFFSTNFDHAKAAKRQTQQKINASCTEIHFAVDSLLLFATSCLLLHCCSRITLIPQLYKVLHGMPPKKKDLNQKHEAQRRRQRRQQPPPPPSSLVKLLQKDPLVYTYFESLQANLQADVQLWKDRANHWKQEYESLLEKSHPQDVDDDQKPSARSSKKRSRKGASLAVRDKNDTTTRTNHEYAERKQSKHETTRNHSADKNTTKNCGTVPSPTNDEEISDAFFDFASSDDEEEKSSANSENGNRSSDKKQSGSAPLKALELSSSDSDEESNEIAKHAKVEFKVAKTAPLNTHISNSDSSSDDDDSFDVSKWQNELGSQDTAEVAAYDEQTLRLLTYAYECFEWMKSPLMEEVGSSIDKSQMCESDNDDEQHPAKHHQSETTNEDDGDGIGANETFLRRSDEEVAADILHAVKHSCRSQSEDEAHHEYKPLFVTHDFIPACNYISEYSHPSREVKIRLFRALMILDAFACPSISDETWIRLFDKTNDFNLASKMSCGLRGRKTLVERLIQSLRTEIATDWAIEDRKNRHALVTTHWDGVETVESRLAQLSASAKHHTYLSTLIERSILCQIVVAYDLSKDDEAAALNLMLNYILSSVPALRYEQYPKLPPVMSLVVLESILRIDKDILWWYENENDSLWQLAVKNLSPSGCKMLLLSIFGTAIVWKERLKSPDDRIFDSALVEVASFDRLKRLIPDLGAFSDVDHNGDLCYSYICSATNDILSKITRDVSSSTITLPNDPTLPLESVVTAMAMIMCCVSSAGVIKSPSQILVLSRDELVNSTSLLLSYCIAVRQLCIRTIDDTLDFVGQSRDIKRDQFKYDLLDCFEKDWPKIDPIVAIKYCLLLSDGESLCRSMDSLFHSMKDSNGQQSKSAKLRTIIEEVSQRPLVRVINLQRRHDRALAFYSQALRERLLVVKGVPSPSNALNENVISINETQFGGYSIDGSGSMVETQKHLIHLFGSQDILDALVAPRWRPNDLRPFDKNAPLDPSLTYISSSERACALSHMLSWNGVISSLSLSSYNATNIPGLRHPSALLRLSRISGFASGPALDPNNANMPPCPVCIIMEDDAILTDHFTEKLIDLLQELPRDFHFCSLGYSRPKAAPIVKMGSLVGITTGFWYLTGYILSLSGAQYLKARLPIVGPVDSWISLMCLSNWDNSFGVSLGVGTHSKALVDPPPLADLCRIFQFRAYCALQPLCWQKVNNEGRQSWRNRDTDIQYSGNLTTSKRYQSEPI
jgi:GR25 family glycosyltransferase involved in LPS biosynthesis